MSTKCFYPDKSKKIKLLTACLKTIFKARWYPGFFDTRNVCKLCFPKKISSAEKKKLLNTRLQESVLKSFLLSRIFYYKEFFKILAYEKIDIPGVEKSCFIKENGLTTAVFTNVFTIFLVSRIFWCHEFVERLESKRISGQEKS